MSDIPPDVVLPCGCVLRCRIVDERKEFQITPCQIKCENLSNAIELATGKVSVEFREAP